MEKCKAKKVGRKNREDKSGIKKLIYENKG